MICPYCRGDLGGAAVRCGGCDTWLHGECALAHGGCTTFGCEGGVFASGPPARARRALTPALPPGLALRRALRGALEVALAPREDLSLAVLSAAGALGLLLAAGVG